ncbi:hypothetical protein [Melghirimyces profundicolus]|nr:hypothetical protein [Melghirimyces profundicolus]
MSEARNLMVVGQVKNPLSLSESELEKMDDGTVRPGDRVPGLEGSGVELSKILERAGLLPGVTHVIFHASDEFRADIPLGELEKAFFLYRQEGRSPEKTHAIRLYVPDGSSNCLNVKSVVRVDAVVRVGDEADRKAEFGFKQVISPDRLRR